jgi:RNA recognition motif-containing protein
MATVLHVGNLSPTVDDHDLEQLFAEHGTVRHAAVVRLPTAGDTEDGIVEMPCDEEAEAAISALNGHAYCGRLIVVRLATGRQQSNAAATSAFGTMNIPDASELGSTSGPCPGGFGDRGGKGPGGALHHVPGRAASSRAKRAISGRHVSPDSGQLNV